MVTALAVFALGLAFIVIGYLLFIGVGGNPNGSPLARLISSVIVTGIAIGLILGGILITVIALIQDIYLK